MRANQEKAMDDFLKEVATPCQSDGESESLVSGSASQDSGKGCGRAGICLDFLCPMPLRTPLPLRLPADDIGARQDQRAAPDIKDALDIPAVGAILKLFAELTGMAVALIDLEGTVLASAEWQDICFKFHRAHPESRRRCEESNAQLSRAFKTGGCLTYMCDNHIRNISTPLYVDGRQVANILCGQFLHEDEAFDPAVFLAQADACGFDREEYMSALSRVPRFSRRKVAAVMEFLSQFARMVASLGLAKVQLLKALGSMKRVGRNLRASRDDLAESQEKLSLAMDVADMAFWEFDIPTHTFIFDDRFYALYGTSCGCEGGYRMPFERYFREFLPADEAAAIMRAVGQHLKRIKYMPPASFPNDKLERQRFEYRIVKRTGEIRHMLAIVCHFHDANGDIVRVFGANQDVTESIVARKALSEQMELHAAMVQQASVGVILANLGTLRIVEFNDVACCMLGYTREEFANLKLTDINRQGDAGTLEQHLATLINAGQDTFETKHARKDGSLVDTLVSARVSTIGGCLHSVIFWTDITTRKIVEQALRQRENEMRTLLEHSPDCILRYNLELQRIYLNPAAKITIGPFTEDLTADPLRGTSILDKGNYVTTLRAVLANGQPAEQEVQFRYPDGRIGWALANFIPEFDLNHRVVSVLAVGRDITELVQQREQLYQMAFYDALTGLPNRALFQERLRRETGERKRKGKRFALMVLDIDNFKDVNDALGHMAGDNLLCAIARRLSVGVRESDTFSRLGGDEFALLMCGVGAAHHLASVAASLLDALAEPFFLEGRDVFVTGSLGIAVYPDDSGNIDNLFTFADAALYHAKASGRNNFKFYNNALTQSAAQRLALGGELRKALANAEFELFYQPKVSLPEGRVIGAEALLRWRHPDRGLLTPDRFIDNAEESGLIIDIGHWVLHQACADAARLNSARTAPLRVAVNLSTRQFRENTLVDSVEEALMSNDCQGSWLELEITETAVLHDNPDIQHTLERLSGLGATIAIDDFGTGYSALSYLNRFHVDVLKIDRSFISGMEKDARKAALVKAFITVAQAFNMVVVAEGVELPEQVDCLCAHGCFMGQGYLYGRPTPFESFESLVLREDPVCN